MKRGIALSKTGAIMCKALVALFVLLLIAGLLVIRFLYAFERPLPFAVGLLLGCALSALKVVLLEKSLSRSLDMAEKDANNYSSLQAILRYGLTVAVMLSAVFLPRYVGLFGLILGVLSLQPSAYITSFILSRSASV